MKYSRRDIFFASLLLAAILAGSAILRVYHLGAQSLWSDEGNSAALAARSFAQIAQDAAHDIHPPLYYWLLHAWVQLFGTSEAALRGLSALFGVWLVWGVAELGRRLYSPGTGLAAGVIAGVSAFQIYYSQEARMYILLALLATASMTHLTVFLPREERYLRSSGGQKALSWFPVSGLSMVGVWVLGLYTHYAFPVIIALCTGLYALWLVLTARRGQLLRRTVRWLILLLLTAVCFAPWLSVALQQLTSWPSGGSTMAAGEGLATSFTLLGLGPAGRDQTGSWQVWVLAALALVGALPWRAILAPFISRDQAVPPASQQGGGTEQRPTSAGSLHGVPGAPLAALVAAPLASAPAAAAAVAAVSPGPLVAVTPAARPAARARRERAGRPMTPEDTSLAYYWLRWLGVILWALAPIIMMLVLGLFRDAYLKFLLIASPAYALLLARAVTGPANAILVWQRGRPARAVGQAAVQTSTVLGIVWAVAALVVIGVISILAVNRYYTDPSVARDDYRGIAQFISATSQPGDAIVLNAPGQAEVFDYYYRGDLRVFPLPRQRPLDRAATLVDLDGLVAYNKVYVLYWAAREADPSGLISDWLNNRSYKMLDQWRGNVRLAVYAMPEQGTPDETAYNLNLKLGPDLTLLGYRGWNLNLHAGEVTQVQLIWRADQTPARRYKVFLQLLDPRDQVIAQRDAEPAGESRPTNTWEPGGSVLDNHGLLIPPGTPPGTYRRIVGMYDVETMERLHLPSGEDHISLPPITVSRSPAPPALEALNMQFNQSFDFGSIKLLGYDRYKRDFKHAPQTPLHPGDRLHLTFYWQANTRPRADWWCDVTLTDDRGRTVTGLQAQLVGPSYSTTLWEAHEVVRGEQDLVLPSELPPGTYRLSLTLLPDTNTSAGVAYLGSVDVEPREQGKP